MEVEQLFDGVYRIDGRIATLNLVKGNRVYDEQLFDIQGKQYRSWTPYRSKLSAAIANGLKTMAIKSAGSVLYLGASTGTTPSHVSDIVGADGRVYAVEMSERSVRDFVKVCQARQNMLPILANAAAPESYAEIVETCDVIYQDISAREQAGILKMNSRFLKPGGFAYFIIKSQSIDISRAPEGVFKEALAEVSDTLELVEKVKLEPYDSMHMFAVLRKR